MSEPNEVKTTQSARPFWAGFLAWDVYFIPTFLPLLILFVLHTSTPGQLLDVIHWTTASEQPGHAGQIGFLISLIVSGIIAATQFNRLRLVNLYLLEDLGRKGVHPRRADSGFGMANAPLFHGENWKAIFCLPRLKPEVRALGNSSLYRALIMSLWTWTLLPVVLVFLWHMLSTRLDPSYPETAPLVAATCAFMLIVLTTFTISFYALASPMAVSYFTRLITLTPVIAFLARMFLSREFVNDYYFPTLVVAGVLLVLRLRRIRVDKYPPAATVEAFLGIAVPFSLFLFAGFEPGKEIANEGPIKGRRDGKVQVVEFQSLNKGSAQRDYPLTFIALGGGGSRAAIFNAAILSKLWWLDETLGESDWPDKGLDASGVNALLKELRATHPDVAAIVQPGGAGKFYPGRLILIFSNGLSTISGGSLAGAYFVRRVQVLSDFVTTTKDPFGKRARAMEAFFDPEAEKRLVGGSVGDAPAYPIYVDGTKAEPTSLEAVDCRRQDWDGSAWQLRRTLTGLDLDDKLWKSFESNPYLASMRLNHLAATVSGFFDPLSGRVASLTNFWNDRFGWAPGGAQVRMSDLAPAEKIGVIPHIVINATIAETGGRLAITNLNSGVFGHSTGIGFTHRTIVGQDAQKTVKPELDLISLRTAAEHDQKLGRLRRFSPPQGAVTTLRQFDQEWDIPLSRAVVASSGFPVGFPLMTIVDPFRNLWHTTDAGVCDNTGLDTVMAMLRSAQDLPLRQAFVLSIDTSQMPIDAGEPKQLYFHYDMASKAIWRSSIYAQQTLTVQYIRDLSALMARAQTGRELIPDPFDVVTERRIPGGPNSIVRKEDSGAIMGPATFNFDGIKGSSRIWASYSVKPTMDFSSNVKLTGVRALNWDMGFTSPPQKELPAPYTSEKEQIVYNPPGDLPNTYIAGYYGKNYGFYHVQMGEYANDFVPTSWHLMPSDRVRVYREVCSQECTETLRRAAFRYLKLLIEDSAPPKQSPANPLK